jgi:hypothetical protein
MKNVKSASGAITLIKIKILKNKKMRFEKNRS